MTLAFPNRNANSAAVGLAAGTAGAFALLLLINGDSQKVLYSIIAGVLLVVCAVLSGNLRIFNLWCFAVTLTLDLSKHFGPLYEKMGGEAAFKVEVSDVFLLIMAAYQVRDIVRGDRPFIRIPKLTYLWAVLIGMGLIPICFGPYRLTAVHEMVRMAKVLILFVVLTNELDRRKRLLQCVAALSLAMISQSIVGFVQYFYRRPLGLTLLGEANPGTMDQLAEQTLSGVKAFRVSALMSHPNIFSIFLAVAILLAVAAFLVRIGKGYKLLFLTSAVIGMIALILTQSRSGWLSASAGMLLLIVLMVLHPGLQGRAILLGSAAGAALLIVCIIFSGPILTRLYESKDSAMLSRAEYNQTARAMIAVRPILGWGLNSYVWVAPPFTKWGPEGAKQRFKGWLPPVHNIYLLWTAETGYVGFALHLWLWIWVIVTAIRNLRISDELMYAINLACLAGLMVYAIDGFFSFTWRINSIMRLYWLLAAVIMSIRYYRLGRQTDHGPTRS